MKTKVGSFERELKLKGLQLTDGEIEFLKNIAIKEERDKYALKTYKVDEQGYRSMLIISTAFLYVLDELHHAVSADKSIKFKERKAFNQFRFATKNLIKEFEKKFNEVPELIEPLTIYKDEITEMVYEHMDALNSKQIKK